MILRTKSNLKNDKWSYESMTMLLMLGFCICLTSPMQGQ